MNEIVLENKVYKVLYTYEINNKKYIVYTHDKENKDGFIKSYVGLYDEKKEELLPVKDEKDLEFINSILDKLTKER